YFSLSSIDSARDPFKAVLTSGSMERCCDSISWYRSRKSCSSSTNNTFCCVGIVTFWAFYMAIEQSAEQKLSRGCVPKSGQAPVWERIHRNIHGIKSLRKSLQTLPGSVAQIREFPGSAGSNAVVNPCLAWELLCLTSEMFASISKLFKRSERKAVVERPAASPFKAQTRPAPTPARTPAATEAIYETPGPDSGEKLAISISAILKTLPAELHGKNASGGGKIFISRKLALDQLSRGSVRIKFGELRRSAPPGVFTLSNAEDDRLVELPLGELLA